MDEKAVIFDMDGVLVDSYEPHYESWRKTSEDRGFEMNRDIFASLFGRNSEAFAAGMGAINLSKEEADKWFREKEALYRELIDGDFPAVTGVSALIGELGDNGFKTAIGSSGPEENIQCVLDNLKNADKFICWTSGDEVENGKPAPDVFLKTAEKLGLNPQKCAVIEDSIHGLEAAKKADMCAIGITTTTDRKILEKAADIVVDKMSELNPGLIEKLIENK